MDKITDERVLEIRESIENRPHDPADFDADAIEDLLNEIERLNGKKYILIVYDAHINEIEKREYRTLESLGRAMIKIEEDDQNPFKAYMVKGNEFTDI